MDKGHFAPEFHPHFGFSDIGAALFAGYGRTHP